MRVVSGSDGACALSALAAGARATVCGVRGHRRGSDRAERLAALGVTAGAAVTILQVFPGIVFLCDQTEIAVEREVAESILVKPADG